MMMNSKDKSSLVLGYDLDYWNTYGEKRPISVDLSPQSNSHILICGMSGSDKSYLEQAVLAKLALAQPDGEIYFGDYKGDDSFSYLRGCPHYYSYKETLGALEIVHSRLLARQSGEDTSRNPVTLIWDEYMAQALSLMSEDKKTAAVVMNKVSEILFLGRSLSTRIIISSQRPDALAFPAGSRLNVGVQQCGNHGGKPGDSTAYRENGQDTPRYIRSKVPGKIPGADSNIYLWADSDRENTWDIPKARVLQRVPGNRLQASI